MSEHPYPFSLKGPQVKYWGRGSRDGTTQRSGEFSLRQGIVVAEVEHHGRGNFKLEFVNIEGFSRGEATAAGLGGTVVASAAAGAATGAIIGSIVPVAGTVLGVLFGGAAGYLAGTKTGDAITTAISPDVWTLVQWEGEVSTYAVARVKEGEKGCPKPGTYRLEVESESGWACRFIQPDLGQLSETMLGGDEDPYQSGAGAGVYVGGPYISRNRPVLASIRHTGGGVFYLAAYALDGTHQYIFAEEGQFYGEDMQTDIRPGKEYMLYIQSDGEWFLNFTEGY